MILSLVEITIKLPDDFQESEISKIIKNYRLLWAKRIIAHIYYKKFHMIVYKGEGILRCLANKLFKRYIISLLRAANGDSMEWMLHRFSQEKTNNQKEYAMYWYFPKDFRNVWALYLYKLSYTCSEKPLKT